MPTTAWAALLATALVPGLLFLRLTASHRLPRRDEGFHAVLEVVGIGVATTGIAFGIFMALQPSELQQALTHPLETPGDARRSALIGLGVLVLALVLAGLWSLAFNCLSQDEYEPSVWQDVLRPRRGYLRVLAIQMADGSVVEGVLRGYDFHADGRSRGRNIALRDPIRITNVEGVEDPPIDRIVVAEDEIQSFRVKYVPDGNRSGKDS